MSRKGILVHLAAWSTLLILIIIGGEFGLVEGNDEVRSRPFYQKSRPKLVLPKQLQQAKSELKSRQEAKGVGTNPNLVTQTVYGFLDFVTTVGNTVMVFTPQTKKADIVYPSSSTSVRETVLLEPTENPKLGEATSQAPSRRGARLLHITDEDVEDQTLPVPVLLESSEYEPQIFATPATSTPEPTTEHEYINLMTDSSPETFESEESVQKLSILTSGPKVRSQVNVVTAVKTSESSSTETPAKGFTLKLARPLLPLPPPKPSTVTPEAQAVKQEELFPTGLVSHNFETKVKNGLTTVHETKILGTFVGTQYARVLESSSTILPIAVTPSNALPLTTNTKVPNTPRKLPRFIDSIPEAFEVFTEKSVSSSGDLVGDDRFNEELLENEEGLTEALGLNEDELGTKTEPHPAPTPAPSDDSTQYILPEQESPAQIYASSAPSPNAYSRQPQIYVDVSPAKSFDYIVTATPSRKPFRPHSGRSSESFNRFKTSRFNKNPRTTTESNELALSDESTSERSPPKRPSSRFRVNRNRSGFKPYKQSSAEREIFPTVASVYSNAIVATAARKFTRGGRFSGIGRSHVKSGQQFKLGGRSGGRQGHVIPTSSTSIYRFKLNRPTGRWRFKPSPKPKVNIIKTKEEEDLGKQEILEASTSNGAVYPEDYNDEAEELEDPNEEDIRPDLNELAEDVEPELVTETLRVATVTPTEFTDFDNSRYLEIATIRSPYVFQAGNVKNTRYITVTKTFTKEMIQPTQASASFDDPTLENILATRPPYEKVLEGSNNIATFPLIILGSDTATPPLETVTQTFSTTQLMLKTSILPVLYEGVTTLYTLTQSYFVTRLVTAHKTIPPMELFHFVPTKSLTEFNTALQEAGTEHQEQLLGSETETSENETNYEHIIAPPDELSSVGSDFDPTSMDEKIPSNFIPKESKALSSSKSKPVEQAGLPDFSRLSPEQLAFLRYFATGRQHQQQGLLAMRNPLQNYFSPLLPSIQPQFPVQVASSPVVHTTVATIVDTKTLRIQFGSKPTQTVIYSTRIVPTKVTSYVAANFPSTPAIPNFFQPAPYPLAFVG